MDSLLNYCLDILWSAIFTHIYSVSFLCDTEGGNAVTFRVYNIHNGIKTCGECRIIRACRRGIVLHSNIQFDHDEIDVISIYIYELLLMSEIW